MQSLIECNRRDPNHRCQSLPIHVSKLVHFLGNFVFEEKYTTLIGYPQESLKESLRIYKQSTTVTLVIYILVVFS